MAQEDLSPQLIPQQSDRLSDEELHEEGSLGAFRLLQDDVDPASEMPPVYGEVAQQSDGPYPRSHSHQRKAVYDLMGRCAWKKRAHHVDFVAVPRYPPQELKQADVPAGELGVADIPASERYYADMPSARRIA